MQAHSRIQCNSRENQNIHFILNDWLLQGFFVWFSVLLFLYFYHYVFNLEIRNSDFVKHRWEKSFIHPKHHSYLYYSHISSF